MWKTMWKSKNKKFYYSLITLQEKEYYIIMQLLYNLIYKELGEKMKIGIASDHRGYKMKQELIKYLNSKGFEVVDYGTNSLESVDHPIFAFELCENIGKSLEKGILICGTGIGMSIAANKVKGIRCAKVSTIEEAKLSREHNDANVIALSANVSLFKLKKIINTFMNTSFLNEEKYIKRNKMVDDYVTKL